MYHSAAFNNCLSKQAVFTKFLIYLPLKQTGALYFMRNELFFFTSFIINTEHVANMVSVSLLLRLLTMVRSILQMQQQHSTHALSFCYRATCFIP